MVRGPAGTCVVMSVDDDPSIRHMLERVLSRTYDLVVAADGELALAEIQRQRPDLVLLDLRMPVMDGSELLERLEAEGIDVPVVLMTAEIRHGFPPERWSRSFCISGFSSKYLLKRRYTIHSGSWPSMRRARNRISR